MSSQYPKLFRISAVKHAMINGPSKAASKFNVSERTIRNWRVELKDSIEVEADKEILNTMKYSTKLGFIETTMGVDKEKEYLKCLVELQDKHGLKIKIYDNTLDIPAIIAAFHGEKNYASDSSRDKTSCCS